VLIYEPPHRLVISWDGNLHWQLETDHEKPARWRCGSSRKERIAPGSSLSTATSTVTETDGNMHDAVGSSGGWPAGMRALNKQLQTQSPTT
jgi:uncharacterized protein YndB with AHSA1/START domain